MLHTHDNRRNFSVVVGDAPAYPW